MGHVVAHQADHRVGMPLVSVALAVIAAVLFAVSTTLQQGAARSTALDRVATTDDVDDDGKAEWLPVLNLLRPLLRDPGWLLGWLLNVLGFAAHAIALHLGSIAAVQAILVVQLMFALMITAARRSLRPTPRDWFATASVCVGVATLVLLRGDVRQSLPPRGWAVAFLLVLAGLVITILGVARRIAQHAQTRTALVAVGAGLCFCATAVLVVVVAHDMSGGLLRALDWPLVCLVGSAIAGSLLVQDSFASGSLPTALTAMTITDPLASAVAGALLFDTTPPAGLELALALPVSAVLIVAGVVLLANSPTVHDETRQAVGAKVSV
jgi:drug/metabolite transporter (DMT)-like permease